MVIFYLVGQVLSMTEVRLLVLAADPHLAAGGWGVGYMGAGLANPALPNPLVSDTRHGMACQLGLSSIGHIDYPMTFGQNVSQILQFERKKTFRHLRSFCVVSIYEFSVRFTQTMVFVYPEDVHNTVLAVRQENFWWYSSMIWSIDAKQHLASILDI